VAEQRRRDAAARTQATATGAGTEQSAALPALDPRPNPADTPPAPAPAPPAHRRSGTGQRTPGQQVACGWCGQLITIGARGPVPKWCSANCRHRAWEQHRAAQAGLAAVHVHDRYIQAIPNDTDGWINQLAALTDQIHGAGENRSTRYPDLDRLAAALDAARAAIDTRHRRLPPYQPD
jgi:hypothetical protein